MSVLETIDKEQLRQDSDAEFAAIVEQIDALAISVEANGLDLEVIDKPAGYQDQGYRHN